MSRLWSNGMPRSANATSRRTAGEGSCDKARASARTDGFDAAQRAERGDADLRIGVGELPLDFAHAVRTELRPAARLRARDG